MQQPTTRVIYIQVICPVHREVLSGPYSGIGLWSQEDCVDAVEAGEVNCHACEHSHPVPEGVKKLARGESILSTTTHTVVKAKETT